MFEEIKDHKDKTKDIDLIDIFGIQESLKNSFISETDISFTMASNIILF